jgi:hypothetical protein
MDNSTVGTFAPTELADRGSSGGHQLHSKNSFLPLEIYDGSQG